MTVIAALITLGANVKENGPSLDIYSENSSFLGSAPAGGETPSALLPSAAALIAARVSGADQCRAARKAVRYYRAKVAEYSAQMGRRVSGTIRGGPCPRYLAKIFRAKAQKIRMAYRQWFTRTYEKWRCIHEHEGAWTSNTGNGYWGGLQMDWGFQHTYGPEFIRRYGLAHRWPVWAQLIAAERAFDGFAGFGPRGYHPWGTRGMCGL